jgi:hypothetical protein
VCSLILFLGVENISEEIWSISKGCPPLPPTPPPPPPTLLELQKYASTVGTPQTNYCSLHLDISKYGGIGLDFFSLKVKNSIPRNRVRQRWKTIAVEGMTFAFGFSKKYNISLLSIECRVLDRCRAFDQLACVDAHLWLLGPGKQLENNY